MKRVLGCAAAALVAGLGGCYSHAHLSQSQGVSFSATFARQVSASRPTDKGPVSGLDSQDAAIIAQTYHRSLAPRNTTPREQPILMVGPSSEPSAYVPPPSVPRQQ
jgi:hypothetical protein